MGFRTPTRFFEGLLLLCLLAHVVFVMHVGRMLQMDEVFFKAAGREWGTTGRFAAPECGGFQNFQPPLEDIFFAQPPIYTFLFGGFVRIFGFERWQCILFDELIHVFQAWLTFRLALRLDRRLPPALCFVLALAMLPLGKFGRSDELATCFGMMALLPLLGPPVGLRAALLAGVCIGLSAGTSAPAGAMLGIVAINVLLFRAEGIGAKLRLVTALGVASLLTFALVLAPILIPRPDAYHQFMDHVRWQYEFQRFGFRTMMMFALSIGLYYYLYTFLLLAVGLLCLAFNRKHLVEVHWGMLWLGPIGALVFAAVNLPYKFTYLWFVGPWLLVTAAANVHLLLPHVGPWRARVLLMTTYLAVALGAVPILFQHLVALGIPKDQAYDYNVARVRAVIPPGSTVVTGNYWWALSNDCRVYEIQFSFPKVEEVDYIILTNDKGVPGGSETILPELRPEYVQNHFTVLDDNQSREFAAIGGWQLPNSAFGFGAKVLGQMGPRKEELERKIEPRP